MINKCETCNHSVACKYKEDYKEQLKKITDELFGLECKEYLGYSLTHTPYVPIPDTVPNTFPLYVTCSDTMSDASAKKDIT